MEKQDIINLEQYADALRSTGYKNIESAVSEIVDNSLEAEAKDVFIIAKSKSHEVSGFKHVNEIAFLDNGFGMDKDLLQSCLRVGYGTRTGRKGMGRFGVGLPQASMHVCPLVEAYSWTGGIENCHMSFLDIEQIRNGTQKYFESPVKCQIPKEYEHYLKCSFLGKEFNFLSSGTLIIWKNTDNCSPKTVNPLFKRLEFALGQKFRYWIYERTKNIYLIDMDNESNQIEILPNDPLFLMERNLVLGNREKPSMCEPHNPEFNEQIFEPFTNEVNATGIVVQPIKYLDKETQQVKESNVTVKFSVVKKEFYDQTAFPSPKNPGDYKIGKSYAKKLEGISIVRAGREIDFGRFDFYEAENSPYHRWWGCEISFEPELDEVFGVANNKQHVELIKLDDDDYEFEDENKPIWFQLIGLIGTTISSMVKRNSLIRKGSRGGLPKATKTTEDTIKKAESKNPVPTESDTVRAGKPKEELEDAAIKILEEQGVYEPTEEDIQQILLNKVTIVYKSNNRAPFFDHETSLGICKCIINTDHIFYQKFMSQIMKNDDARVSFELFLASLIRARDETIDSKKKEMYDEVIDQWNYKLTFYIKGLESNG